MNKEILLNLYKCNVAFWELSFLKVKSIMIAAIRRETSNLMVFTWFINQLTIGRVFELDAKQVTVTGKKGRRRICERVAAKLHVTVNGWLQVCVCVGWSYFATCIADLAQPDGLMLTVERVHTALATRRLQQQQYVLYVIATPYQQPQNEEQLRHGSAGCRKLEQTFLQSSQVAVGDERKPNSSPQRTHCDSPLPEALLRMFSTFSTKRLKTKHSNIIQAEEY